MRGHFQEGYCSTDAWCGEFATKPFWHFSSFLSKAAETAVCICERRNVECFETEKPVAASKESTEEQNTRLQIQLRNGMESILPISYRTTGRHEEKSLAAKYWWGFCDIIIAGWPLLEIAREASVSCGLEQTLFAAKESPGRNVGLPSVQQSSYRSSSRAQPLQSVRGM